MKLITKTIVILAIFANLIGCGVVIAGCSGEPQSVDENITPMNNTMLSEKHLNRALNASYTTGETAQGVLALVYEQRHTNELLEEQLVYLREIARRT